MKHPKTAPGGWKLDYVVYPGSPGEISVGVLYKIIQVGRNGERKTTHRMLGLRWCEKTKNISTWQDGSHDWFVLPFTFGAAITRSLLQMKATGFTGFDESGMQKLIDWMTDLDQQAIDDGICY